MKHLLEERKQQYLIILKNKLFPAEKSKSVWAATPATYKSTLEISRSVSRAKPLQTELIIKERPTIVLAVFLIVASLVAFFSSFREAHFVVWLFLAFFIYYGIKLLSDVRKGNPRLRVDLTGIYYHEWNGYIEWKNIIALYIKEDDDGEYASTSLLISFYREEEDCFMEQEIILDGLKTDVTEISHFLEYVKSKAGFTTVPADY